MSQVDLNNLSLDELALLQKNAQNLMKSKKKQQIQEAYGEFQKIAKNLGVSIDDILKAGKGVKNKRPFKYQNPSNKAEGWSGQGRKPKWLTAELDKGKTLESFLIK